jgi:hypothetical protein
MARWQQHRRFQHTFRSVHAAIIDSLDLAQKLITLLSFSTDFT